MEVTIYKHDSYNHFMELNIRSRKRVLKKLDVYVHGSTCLPFKHILIIIIR